LSILEQIKAYKLDEVAETARRVPESALRERLPRADPVRSVSTSLRVAAAAQRIGVIAEIKRRSPTKGEIRPGLDPAKCAAEYERGGAAALSVLTDHRSFGGSLEDLTAARNACQLAVIRKEFIFKPYQVLESRAWSADAVLLILAVLEASQAAELHAYAVELGLEVMVETHTREQVETALDFGATMIGINNRDLHTFTADLNTTVELCKVCPPEVLVISESGISGSADVEYLIGHGVRAFLVGESLIRQPDLVAAVRALMPTTPLEES